MENTYKSVKSFRKDLPPEGYGNNEEDIDEYITSLTVYDDKDHVLEEISYHSVIVFEMSYYRFYCCPTFMFYPLC